MTLKLKGFTWDAHKAYFFSKDQYIRYKIFDGFDHADEGYPSSIAGHWGKGSASLDKAVFQHNGSSVNFASDLDAVVRWPNGFAYFFKGDHYIKYNTDPANEGVVGTPQPIAGHWGKGSAGLEKAMFQRNGVTLNFASNLDAVVLWPNGFAYFFKGDHYIKYNTDPANEGVVGKPQLIAGPWQGLPAAFTSDLDTIVVWPNGFAYFFKGDQYVKYVTDPAHEGVAPNYPRPIRGNWHGLTGGVFGEPDIAIIYSQPANFYVFDDQQVPNTTTGAGSGMFMVYRIRSIMCPGLDLFKSSDFTFDLSKVVVSTIHERSGNTSLDLVLRSAPDTLPLNFTPHFDVGTIVVNVSGDPVALKTSQRALHYLGPSGLAIQIRRNSGDPPTWFADPMTPEVAASLKGKL